ncbi:uncharacterized protein METZ01_LOCUS129032, partial [marine metagenome]
VPDLNQWLLIPIQLQYQTEGHQEWQFLTLLKKGELDHPSANYFQLQLQQK